MSPARSSQDDSSKTLRRTEAFASLAARRQYQWTIGILIILSVLMTYGLIVYENPVPMNSPSYIPIVMRRLKSVAAMGLVAICQGMATITFQSLTHNRILSPSLLGFEAIYSTIQTGVLFLLGTQSFLRLTSVPAFVLQLAVMLIVSTLLYTWLLDGRRGDLHRMLLVGLILAGGLRAVSTLMRRILAPSEFDLLQARLFASVNHAQSEYFPIAVPLVIISAILLYQYARRLNVLSLGRDVATNMGLHHNLGLRYGLALIAILMAVSTAFVGPMTFLGFLVAALTYQLAQTYHHKYLFVMAILLGYVILTSAYFLMNHVVNAQGVVSIIIELVGGLTFIVIILRKGNL